MPKYTFNAQGALINPERSANGANQLAVVSSIQQVQEMSQDTTMALTLPHTTVTAIALVQSDEYRSNFSQEHPENEGELLEEISREFNKLELSLGLLEKLSLLKGRHLNFWLDDSGSMAGFSDVPFSEAHPALKSLYDSSSAQHKKRIADIAKISGPLMMTRWAEEQNRLHIFVDLLAYIPTGPISFTFINKLSNTLTVTPEQRRQMTPTQFKEQMHNTLCQLFNRAPTGSTPLNKTLIHAFQNTSVSMVHYLMTDGEPSDCLKTHLAELIETRGLGYRNKAWDIKNVPADVMHKATLNPLILISCTNDSSEVAYFKEIDETAPMVAEIDDFNEEKKEVISKQGNAFPFTKGLWILCQLVAALDPYGLDKLDEPEYLSMEFLSLFVGRELTANDYNYYKQYHSKTKSAIPGVSQNSYAFYNNNQQPLPGQQEQTENEQASNCVIC